MRFYVLSDRPDTLLGLRMAGMAGELINETNDLLATLTRLGKETDIGVIVLTAGLIRMAPDFITNWKLKRHKPLIVEVPDQMHSEDISQNIARYIANTIGLQV